jgi:hypothetical protein
MELSGQIYPLPLYPRETAPSMDWIGAWMGPKTGLDEVGKRKVPVWGMKPRFIGCPACYTD